MKTFRMFIVTIALACTALTMNAQPMSYYAMRDNARYLTDRMAYTLGLSADLLDDLYCINYDYICGVNDYLDDVALGYRYDDYMAVMAARDAALRRLLTLRQWRRLVDLDYFYRPIAFSGHRWSFSIYRYEPYRASFYFRPPTYYADYRGGRFFRGMAPAPRPNGRPLPPPPSARPGRGYHFESASPRPDGPRYNYRGNLTPARPEAGRDNNRGNFTPSRPESGRDNNNRGNFAPSRPESGRDNNNRGNFTPSRPENNRGYDRGNEIRRSSSRSSGMRTVQVSSPVGRTGAGVATRTTSASVGGGTATGTVRGAGRR